MSEVKKKILVLAADPRNLARVRFDEEVREITHKTRERFEVTSELAVKSRELIELLVYHKPDILHFCGHAETDAIFLELDDGNYAPVSTAALKAIFAELKSKIQLVFLNACFTMLQAEAIYEFVECAVGTQKNITDRAAIAFATSFYSYLMHGATVGEAFKLGEAQLLILGMQGEADLKLLSKKPDVYLTHIVEEAGASAEANPVPEIETDPTGRVYVSYAPSRISDAQLIASALIDRGVPVCEEALADDRHFMDAAIREVLQSPGTSGGLLALTSEAVDARSVTSVELPLMLDRASKKDAFFIAATRLSDFESGDVGTKLHSLGISIKNISDAREIARLVLDRRIEAIHNSLPPNEPLHLDLYTRVQPPFKQGTALLIDWAGRFSPRFASPETWDDYLLPALRDVVRAIELKAPGRAILADGRPSLPAAIALGCAFIQPKNIKIQWAQHTLGRPDQFWSIDEQGEDSGLELRTSDEQADAVDLAVLVSVTANVEIAYAEARNLPDFRAIIRASKSPFGIQVINNAAQARDAAFKIQEEVRRVIRAYSALGTIHLFMAVPAGLAMMIGQLLNTLGSIQTYDLETPDAGGRYRRAALLTPCD